jgi:hypothetical protein
MINRYNHCYESSYNHNYYFSAELDDLILETCNDCDEYVYDRVTPNGLDPLGYTYDVFGIFDADYEGPMNDDGTITLY